jgi:hypothetical protein
MAPITEDHTPRSNALFSAIVATVAASGQRQLTVRELAVRVGASEHVVAHCIALHRYLRTHAKGRTETAILTSPLPEDFSVPAADDAIDEEALGLGIAAG